MIQVPFPPPQFRIKKKGEKQYIFDAIRKSWLLLTEEEWVRQNLVAYFTTVLHYPKQAIALEKEIFVNGLKKRFDILVYDAGHQPWMLVECKAPAVVLSEDVLQQALRYHLSVPVEYLVICNGVSTVAWKKAGSSLELSTAFPGWR
ncbi:type I restriction enzyme HsdR N-terminal domain-containing protein [Flavisolibacter nicotianae]|uniref:type I restriction enzyme HsdR N-terminal domain-containing protein n=1 Tax=Flavisolibacter nicotianae TaxID=2364882 RepID=UPI000EAD5CE6|nr:type I restriction enzyme HsdR N-terminal domain-containing protein [Flavisolibacter nicotianae]